MPSGYVYLGQFIDHDLTREERKVAETTPDVKNTPNNRTPRLDLDHLYGKDPTLASSLYHGGRLKLGETLPGTFADGTPAPPGMNDLHRDKEGTTCLIDPREDQNLIIAQMHVLWSKLHNRFFDLLPTHPELWRGLPAGERFDQARRLVTWHYQWIIWNDFLPHIVKNGILKEVKALKWRLYKRQILPEEYPVRLPIEFTLAAFRFGHTMVQEVYRLHRLKFESIETVLKMTKPGGGITEAANQLRADFVIDWRFFFTDTMHNFGEDIDTNITEKLYDLEMANVKVFRSQFINIEGDVGCVPHDLRFSLPWMTLIRGWKAGLPTGEQFARFFNYTPLSTLQMCVWPGDEVFFGDPSMRDQTPLWYYLLREAAVEKTFEPATAADPTPIQKLGTIGSRIVAEVLAQVLWADADSILNAGGHWEPPFIKPDSFRLNSMAAIVDWLASPAS
jgi:hypothetical protein